MENPFASSEGLAAITRRLQPQPDEGTVQDYVDDAWARAVGVAPQISEESFPPQNKPEQADQITAILRAIILRWHEAQSGAVAGRSQMAGPYQQNLQLDSRPKRGYTLMPSEVLDLQRIARRQGAMFSVDTFPDDDGGPRRTFLNGPHLNEPDW